MPAVTLAQLACVLRSKNAGPFQVTIDLMFGNAADYHRVLGAGILDASRLGRIYGVPPEAIAIIDYERVLAIKITLPRTSGTRGSGSAFDRDVYGAQQHGPVGALRVT